MRVRIFKDENANQVWEKTTEKLISSATTCAGYYLYPVYVKVTQYSPTRVTTYTPVKCDSAGPYYKTSRLEPTRITSGSPTIVYVVPPTGWVATTPDYGKTLKPNSTVSVWHGVRR